MAASEVCWTLEQYGCRGLLASVLRSTSAKRAVFSPASPGDLVLAFPNSPFHCTESFPVPCLTHARIVWLPAK